jgi:osmotically-inducible protein OsmY
MASALVLALAGCASTSEHASTGQIIDDSVITTKLKTAMLADKEVSGTDVSIETNKGRVLLTGSVKSSAERSKAERIARETAGVRAVENRLTIRGS